MNQRERLKELLLELSFEKREVTLSSGKKSDFYFDGKQTSLHPEGATLIGELLVQELSQISPKIEAVGGPTLGADPLVSAVSIISQQKQKPIFAFIIRKEPKAHGTQAWIEGAKNLDRGMNIAILEDVITSGDSALKAIKRAEEAGLIVRCVLVVVDREEGGRELLESKGYKLVSLFTKTELLA